MNVIEQFESGMITFSNFKNEMESGIFFINNFKRLNLKK